MNPLPLLLLLLLLPCFTISQPPKFVLQNCHNDAGNYTAGSTYRRNLNNLLASLGADTQPTTGFYNLSSGQPGPDRVNVIGLCRGDVPAYDCRSCIADAAGRIVVDCPVQKEALGYYDYCTIRYSNRSIQGSLDTQPTYYMWNLNNVSDPTQFNSTLETLLTRLRASAAGGSSDKKFVTGTERQGSVTIYALVQCSPDLSRRDCDSCLEGAIGQIPICCSGKKGGRVIVPSCQLRFESETAGLFYNDMPPPPPLPPRWPTSQPSPPSPEGGGSKNTSKIAAIVIPIVGAAAILGFIFTFFWRRRRLTRLGIPNQSQRDAMVEVLMSSDGPGKPLLQFDFDTIRAATDNFADARKLGHGGFGAVYKGTLPGTQQDIAVKRLSKHSRQGDLEFKNEGELVAKLQHRNLVRFLGFCLKGNERLLIYEFVPNASLDHFLFDPNKRTHLDWERRYKIISGIARGLVYLHEDSRLRIIHRDLKAGNILLDAKMNPKIADFGLARLFDLDETEGSTRRVVGTYGYMAPEYLMHGNFSIKSDVFSFGVLVLEIVSGKRNRLVHGGSTEEDLLTYAWKSWRNGTYSNLVDPSLGNDNVSGSEITRCIHIGLLCVQKNANDRPTMTSVAQMLTNYSLSLPLPSQPAFFIQTAGAQEGVVVAACSKSAGVDEAVVPLSWNEVSMTDLFPR